MLEQGLFPYEQEQRLLKQWRVEKDRVKRKEIEDQLISLYVYFGEYFKMSRPDPRLAKTYLIKALKYKPSHALANYRLAHIYYREKEYAKAAFHFERALSGGGEDGGLNDTQRMISHMFVTNCGIFLVSRSLQKIKEMEYGLYDEELVERYRSEILILQEENFARSLYRIVTPNGNEIVTEERYFAEQDLPSSREVQLLIENDRHGPRVRYGGEWMSLDYASFYLLAFLLHSERPLTVEEIRETLFQSFLEREVTEVAIRQMIRRLRGRLPFWESIIETTRTGNKVARRRRPDVTYRLFCRASDVFPWE